VHRLPLRAAPGAEKRAGSTGIWGELRNAAGEPIPFALVQVQTRFRGVLASATTWTDASGGYALDLDGERPDPLAAPGTVEEREGKLCLPLQRSAGSTQSWLEPIPVLKQGLVQGISAGTAPTGYAPPEPAGPISACGMDRLGRSVIDDRRESAVSSAAI
jgi:hypothetical protein